MQMGISVILAVILIGLSKKFAETFQENIILRKRLGDAAVNQIVKERIN